MDKEDIAKIAKKTYSQQIHSKLEEMILCGKLRPGEIVTLRGLASAFGVSIIPVRDALAAMESSGLVVKRANRDYRILTLTYHEFCDAMKIRTTLEKEVMLIACKNATKADYYEFRKNLSHMEANLRNESKYIFYHYKYHMSIYRTVNKNIYNALIKNLWFRIGPYMPLMWEKIGYDKSLGSHLELEKVFESRDETELAKTFERHVQIGQEVMLREFFV